MTSDPYLDRYGAPFKLETGERLDPIGTRYSVASRLIFQAVVGRIFPDGETRGPLDEVRAKACAAMVWNGKLATATLVAALVERGIAPEVAVGLVTAHIDRIMATQAGEGAAKVPAPSGRNIEQAARRKAVRSLSRYRR